MSRRRIVLSTLVTLTVLAALPACDVGRVPPLVADDGGVLEPVDASTVAGPRHHPVGFAAASAHGPALIQRDATGAEDCRACHGETLEGTAAAPSCDACHDAAAPTSWRSDCTFCHGGDTDATGAPPRNLDGTRGPGLFPAHGAHVTTLMAAPIDCIECHVKATDVLSEGHVFDGTPGVADVDFGGGRAAQTTFTAQAGCASSYCHGGGRADDGAVANTAAAMTCESCHPGMAGGTAAWATMSGTHALHLGVTGVHCGECHAASTANGTSITAAALHVDGQRQVAFTAAGFTRDAAGGCTGSCHGHAHSGQGWGGGGPGGTYHPAGFADPAVHGPEMALQRQDCRSCHGATLAGGSAPSCNGCHQPTWRTTCTYCHGGTSNQTGAPGRDPGAPKGTVSARFVSHTRHVQAVVTSAYDCTQCHVKPTDVMSTNHAFDGTPGAGEVTFAAGLGAGATFSAATGTCANLYCHGNGRANNGTARDGGAPMTCKSCHPDRTSGSSAWQTMSGDHAKHFDIGYGCNECHATVTSNGTSITNKALHIDKKKQTAFPSGLLYDPATRRCTGSCHGEDHNTTW